MTDVSKQLAPTAPIILVGGVQVAGVTKEHASLYIGNKNLVDRMIWASRHCPNDPWVYIAHNREGRPKAPVILDAESLRGAYLRLARGEEPPAVPRKASVPRAKIKAHRRSRILH